MPQLTHTTRQVARWTAAAALCAAAALPAHAGRPLSVDDAGVNEPGNGHVEVWWEGQRGTDGSFFAAPAYVPLQGLELSAVLSRNRTDNTTLQGLQAKWQWTPEPEATGCHAASTMALRHTRHQSGNEWALNMIGTCKMEWASVHLNAGALRESDTRHWLPTWGAALEHSWGDITGHVEAFGQRHSAPTFQVGTRWAMTKSWQLDGTVGSQSGHTLLSVGFKHSF